MGYQLMSLALAFEGVSDRARLTLAIMGRAAYDPGQKTPHPACLYWAGTDKLIREVLQVEPEQCSPSERRAHARTVQRALAELREAGAIEVEKIGRRGYHSEYRLLIGPGTLPGLEPVDNSDVGASKRRRSGNL